MSILLWIIFGGLAGWIATIIVGDEAGIGIIGNVVIGIVGAFIGGFIADKMGVGGKPGAESPATLISFVWAVVGAVILLLVINFIF